jgi:hypothetical protein
MKIKTRKDRICLWCTMRVLKEFTVANLVKYTGAEFLYARKYCWGLAKHGYLLDQHYEGRKENKPKNFVLLRDTGPLAPILMPDGQAFDPNLFLQSLQKKVKRRK